MSREYPALEVRWPARPEPETIEHLLADLDETVPTAVEDLPNGLRLFFAEPSQRERAAALIGECAPAASCRSVVVSDEDWAERSQSTLTAVEVGSLVVTPPWTVDAADRDRDDRIVILIQPSMGFGTGHHPSTRLVLALLQQLPLRGQALLDVGTGSGVLAIAGWKLGAGHVMAIDDDEDALTSAAENLALNRATAVTLARRDVGHDDVPGTYDIVTANLTGATLARYASRLSRWVAPGGHLLASGFQIDEAPEVARALASAGLEVTRRAEEDGWMAFSASPTDSTGR